MGSVFIFAAMGSAYQCDKLEFGGQGPLPMRFGSEGGTVSTGRRSKRGWAGIGSVRLIVVCGAGNVRLPLPMGEVPAGRRGPSQSASLTDLP